MISLILDYKRGKLPYKRFQLSFPAHHKTLLKINEDQSIITNKFNPLFWEEGTGWGGWGSHHLLSWHRPDPSKYQGLSKWCHWGNIISKFIGMKSRKWPGNINYSTFLPAWPNSCNFHPSGKKKLFSASKGFMSHIFTEEVWDTETRCIYGI